MPRAARRGASYPFHEVVQRVSRNSEKSCQEELNLGEKTAKTFENPLFVTLFKGDGWGK